MNRPTSPPLLHRLRRFTPWASALALTASSPAWAERPRAPPSPGATATSAASPDQVAQAERAFREAAKRMDGGDFEAACPLLEQSQALDPSSGTLLNLGDCYEHLGRTASAWRTFVEARTLAAATARPDRASVADARAARLAPGLRRLIIVPPARTPSDLAVRLDDAPVTAADLNTPMPVDPGGHTVRASAGGMQPQTVNIAAPESGTTTSLRLPELQPSSMASASASFADRSSALDGQQIAALAAGGVGVVGIIAGTVFGVRSMSQHHDSDTHCPDDRCDSTGVELMNDARGSGNLATASFVVGGLGLGAAAVLWFARPSGAHEPAGAALGLGPGSVVLRGSW